MAGQFVNSGDGLDLTVSFQHKFFCHTVYDDVKGLLETDYSTVTEFIRQGALASATDLLARERHARLYISTARHSPFGKIADIIRMSVR